MGVNDVRISPSLTQALWARGIKSPPKRVRVRLERKRNDDEAAKERLYVLATVVEGVTSFKVSRACQRIVGRVAESRCRVCRRSLLRERSSRDVGAMLDYGIGFFCIAALRSLVLMLEAFVYMAN